jgi:sec-independent protein translocase protein TatA
MVAGPAFRQTAGGIVATMPFAWWELVLILLVLLLVFGAKRLPEMGRSLGRGMREFKDSVSGIDDRDERPSSTTGELPAAPSEPTRSETEAEKHERETVS